MSPKKKTAPEPEEEQEPSRAGGALVLTVLAGAGLGGVYAASPAVAVGVVWVVGAGALWKAARRGAVSDSSATPPPPPTRPSCRECAGHTLISATPLEGQKGMLIYKSAPADRPNHTHIHVQEAP
ncbi:hypothetical protein FKN01_29660 [Streptomyces sp. 130]|uniref:hypothetical protein n=1 Tax=Streptomyces sp. 130 TaxID=2591006 RepID=UPI00117C2488|nr:hypothetical protein [Streptomyces sp. 130]TRV72559.1 hypothetical protein FKN01_29660 [Streptomyces sp. 130]